LGAAMFSKEKNWGGTDFSNESQKTLSMINIGLGTTTTILSAWNLITNRKPKDKLTTWNIYSFPAQGNNTGLAFSLTRKL
jgi:tRNA U34 5-methylaminomethyl-2-thiouridine-forming methyltransferase MnmC